MLIALAYCSHFRVCQVVCVSNFDRAIKETALQIRLPPVGYANAKRFKAPFQFRIGIVHFWEMLWIAK
jgi:hypothetical protein